MRRSTGPRSRRSGRRRWRTRTRTSPSGETWHYRVVASNAEGAGPPSNEVSATVPAEPPPNPEPPSAPTALSAAATDSAINLSWSVPDDDGGASIDGYEIYRGESASELAPYDTVGVVTDLPGHRGRAGRDLVLRGRGVQRGRPRRALAHRQRDRPGAATGRSSIGSDALGDAGQRIGPSELDGAHRRRRGIGQRLPGLPRDRLRQPGAGGDARQRTDVEQHRPDQRPDLLVPGRGGELRRPRPAVERGQRHPGHRALAASVAEGHEAGRGWPAPDLAGAQPPPEARRSRPTGSTGPMAPVPR